MALRVAKRKPGRQCPERIPAYRATQARFSQNLRRIRTNRRLTQERAAELCGLAPRHLQMMEAGEVNCTILTLSKLAQGLGIDVADLLAPLRRGR
jgi:transcriptional regulator with XRE-family HTH domain